MARRRIHGERPAQARVAGLEVPVSPHAALLLDGRYIVAHAHLGSEFGDNRNLDLSGGQYVAGVAIHF